MFSHEMKIDLSQTISLSYLYTAGRLKLLYLVNSTLTTQYIVTRCMRLSNIAHVHQWTQKWCPTVHISSDPGQN